MFLILFSLFRQDLRYLNERDQRQTEAHHGSADKYSPNRADRGGIPWQRCSFGRRKEGLNELGGNKSNGGGEQPTDNRRQKRGAQDVEEITEKGHTIWFNGAHIAQGQGFTQLESSLAVFLASA